MGPRQYRAGNRDLIESNLWGDSPRRTIVAARRAFLVVAVRSDRCGVAHGGLSGEPPVGSQKSKTCGLLCIAPADFLALDIFNTCGRAPGPKSAKSNGA